LAPLAACSLNYAERTLTCRYSSTCTRRVQATAVYVLSILRLSNDLATLRSHPAGDAGGGAAARAAAGFDSILTSAALLW
jgi:hypothetical protein